MNPSVSLPFAPPMAPSGRPRAALARAGVVAAALLLVAAALGWQPLEVAAQGGSSRVGIEGFDWQLLEYREAGELQPVPPGIATTASFFAGVLRGDGACSTFDGSGYTLEKETLLITPPQVSTRACDAEGQAIDEAFYRGLDATRSHSVDGSILELRDEVEDPILRFTMASVPDDPTIAPWEVARIAAEDGSIGPVVQATRPTVQFTRGGRVFGSTGCGWYLGAYTTNDTQIEMRDLAFNPSEDCSPTLRAQAESIVDTLASVTNFAVLPAGLTLEDSSGVTKMALVPTIALPNNATWTPISFPGPDGESVVPPERLVTSSLRFGGAKADALSSCRRPISANSFRAGLSLSLYDVTVDDDASRAFCKPAKKNKKKPEQMTLQDIEDIYTQRLAAVASHALRGSELELLDASGTPSIILARQPEFAGVQWVLKEMDTRPRAAKPKPAAPRTGTRLSAAFEPSVGLVIGEMTVEGGQPRAFDAEYRNPRASSLEIFDFHTTGKACNGAKASKPRCRQEQAFLNLLGSADAFVLPSEGQLWLFRGDRKILDFVPAQSLLASNPDADG